jgi:hypothetical protein
VPEPLAALGHFFDLDLEDLRHGIL